MWQFPGKTAFRRAAGALECGSKAAAFPRLSLKEAPVEGGSCCYRTPRPTSVGAGALRLVHDYGGATKIETFFISGPAGALEALLEYEPGASPRLAALACHPHPLYGGTMHNKVVFRASKAAVREGLPALRFNYRGVGKSEGKFGEGAGEEADVRAALENLCSRFSLPVVLMGFSFGSGVGLRVGAGDSRVLALIGLGLAPARHDYSFLRQSRKPKLFIQGTQDQFGPREEVESLIATLPPPKTMHWVDGVDHFFTGKPGEVEEVIRTFLREIAPPLQT